jgi:hypothetical protein
MSQTNQHHRTPGVLAALAFVVLAGACAGHTSLEQGWTSPSAHASPPLTKIVTVFISKSESTRRSGEDRLARELAKNGVAATPEYAVIAPTERAALDGLIDKAGTPEVEAVKAKLMGLGYDGVITMQIVDKDEQLVYSPSYYGYSYGYWGYGGYPGGGVYTTETYRTETTAFSLSGNRLVWSGRLKTVDPESTKQLLGGTSKVVTRELAKQRKAG